MHALGKDANLPIINITPSLIFRKWVGESNQLLKATFTLAEKLKPCIIFIDEMDSMFSSRKDNDQSIDRGIKTECTFNLIYCILIFNRSFSNFIRFSPLLFFQLNLIL